MPEYKNDPELKLEANKQTEIELTSAKIYRGESKSTGRPYFKATVKVGGTPHTLWLKSEDEAKFLETYGKGKILLVTLKFNNKVASLDFQDPLFNYEGKATPEMPAKAPAERATEAVRLMDFCLRSAEKITTAQSDDFLEPGRTYTSSEVQALACTLFIQLSR